MSNNISMLDAALAHAKSGRPVFPLLDKTPLISRDACPTCLGNCENTSADGEPEKWFCPRCNKDRGGAGYEYATTDPQLIEKWWSRWPEAQIGMPTDCYFILEVAAGEGSVGIDSLDALEAEYGILPKTLVQTTPRGWKQCFFKAPEGTIIKSNQSVLGQDIDVRGQGDYAVLAPSKNANGESYVWDTDPDATPIAEAPEWIVGRLTEKSEPSEEDSAADPKRNPIIDAILAEMKNAQVGTRNDTLYSLTRKAGRMIDTGALPGFNIDDLVDAALGTGLEIDEVLDAVEAGLSAAQNGSNSKKSSNSEDKFAVEFVAKHGENTRYCQGLGWMEYSEESRVWKKDRTPSVFENVRQICRSLNTKRKPVFSKASTFRGVLQIAQNDPSIYTTSDKWDSHPWLLGTPSGVVSLNGEPIEVPERELYITKSTRVAPAKGEPVRWNKFLDEITQGDKDLQRYLGQFAGYGLTGITREHAIFFIYGPGGNGKSVFLNTIGKIMGDYAARATMEVFTASKSSFDRHTTDIAMLAGARLVTLSETEEGRCWKESLIKSMTGGDSVSARLMRKDNITYYPQFKMMVVSNNRPKILKVDDAMKRRFNIIPFNFKPKVVDMDLEQNLVEEYPQILQWMIDGCRDWQQNGFVKPQCVLKETEEYFAEQDLTGLWIEENCEVMEDAIEQGGALFQNWKEFMVSMGENKGLNTTRFGNEMKTKMESYDFDKRRFEGGVRYRGIRLKRDEAPSIFDGMMPSLAVANTIQPLVVLEKV